MTNVVNRLIYDDQKDWFNRNNWSIFQSALVSKGATTYRYPSTTNSGIEEKLSFFSENTSDPWQQVGDVIKGARQDDQSGYSVSLSANGLVLAIGEPFHDENGDDSGRVRVYKYENDSWEPMEEFYGAAAGDKRGMSVSLSADGLVLAIGEPFHDENGDDSGRVRVYKYENGSWSKIGGNINGDIVSFKNTGRSVSLNADGSVVAIGSYFPITDWFSTPVAPGTYSMGQVRIYVLPPAAEGGGEHWQQKGHSIFGEGLFSGSARSVSLSADGMFVAIGAPNNDGAFPRSGHVRVYKYRKYIVSKDDGAFHHTSRIVSYEQTKPIIITENDQTEPQDEQFYWTQVGLDIDGDAEDQSGYSVSLSSDGLVVAIGSIMNRVNIENQPTGTRRGHVRVYEYNGSFWEKRGGDIEAEGDEDLSGWSVSLSADGSVVAIGAPFNDGNGEKSGHVRVYKYSPTKTYGDVNGVVGWYKIGPDIDGEAGGDGSGYSVSLSADGSVVAIGAPFNDDDDDIDTGHVRVFRHHVLSQSGISQIKHFNENLDQIASNIIVSRYGPQWEPVINTDSASLPFDSRFASSADGSVIAESLGPASSGLDPSETRIYKYSNGLWKQKGGTITLTNNLQSLSLNFDGSVVAIGHTTAQANDQGKVHVYKFDDNSGSWVNRGGAIIGERPEDYSGYSVSLSHDGSVVAIGAIWNRGGIYVPFFPPFPGIEKSGHVRVYRFNDSTNQWDKLGPDIDGESAFDESGWSVSLSADGSVVAIGAHLNDNNQGVTSGQVRVYKYHESAIGSGWTQRGGDIDGEGAWDRSGYSVSLSADGSVVAIGASMLGGDDRNLDRGMVRVYKYKPGKNYTQTNEYEPNYGPEGWDRVGWDIDGEGEDDYSGSSVSLSYDGSVVAIGSINNNVRVYHYRKYTEDDDKNGVSKFNYDSRTVDNIQSKPLIITTELNASPVVKPLVGNSYWTQVGLDITSTSASVSLSDDGSIVAIGTRLYQIAKRNLWVQQGLDIDGESPFDQSGWSVALSADGSIVAIGAYDYNNNGAGHVRVYQFREGLWQQLGGDIDGEAEGDRSGRSVSLSADGYTVAIGAPDNNSEAGHVRVYELKYINLNFVWSKVGGDINGESAGDESGFSVSLSAHGNVVAIGSSFNTDERGYVRVYEYRKYRTDDNISDNESKFNYTSTVVNDEQTKPILILESSDQTSPQVGNSYWMQHGSDIDGIQDNDYFGFSVSLSADGLIVAIGVPYFNNNNSGHVRVYELKDDTWTKIGEDIDGEAEGDSSGWSVSLSADGLVVAIGATLNDGNGTRSGHVRVFEYREYTQDDDDGNGDSKFHYSSREVNGEQTKPLIITKDFQTPPDVGQSYWIQQGIDIDGEAEDDQSGESVSLSADGSVVAIVAFGNDGDDEADSNRGHVRVYKYDGSSWQQQELDIDGEGKQDNTRSVSLSHDGSVVAIGARRNDGDNGNVADSGHVRVYKFTGWGLGTE